MIKKSYSTYIAVLPLLSLYTMPFLSVNVGLFGLLVFAALHMALFFSSNAKSSAAKMCPVFFYFYIVLNTLVIRLLIPGVLDMGVYYRLFLFITITATAMWAVSAGLVDFAWIRKIVEYVSISAALCIFFQYVCYYLLGRTLGVGRVWLLPFKNSLMDWYYLNDSMVSDGLFRPSAFFLEPSHFAEYGIVALASLLLPAGGRPAKLIQAAILTLGLLLCTSGIGIVMAVVVWGYFLLTSKRMEALSNRGMMVACTGLALVVLFGVLSQFTFFSSAVSRFLSDGAGGENAYAGRLYTSYYYQGLDTVGKWLGTGFQNVPIYTRGDYQGGGYYMVGIVELLYCLGGVGSALCLLTLADGVLHTKHFPQCVAIVYLGMVFVAARLKTVDVVFYLSLVYGGYVKGRERLPEGAITE